MDREKILAIVAELWTKYAYRDEQGLKSDRSKIKEELEVELGREVPLGTLKNWIATLDREKLFSEKPHQSAIMESPSYSKVSKNQRGEITSQIRERLDQKITFTNEELLNLHGINPEENVIKQIVSNEWTMTNSDGETYYNFQSKIIAVPIAENGLTIDEFIERIKVDPKPMEIETIAIGDTHLGIGLADLHFGRTTREMLKRHLAQALDRIEYGGYKTILIAQLGDAFESSQIKQSITLAGTILPTADMASAIQDFKWFMHALIEHASKYCDTVIVTSVCGNHSGNLEYVAMDGLRDRYSLLEKFDHKGEYLGKGKVIVREGNDYRTVEKIGNVGIMLSHGDSVKLKDLPLKFASEYPLVWSGCEHREAWSGHKHNKFIESDNDGNVMRQFPSPKPPTDYEDKWGYNSRELIMMVEFSDDSSIATYEIK